MERESFFIGGVEVRPGEHKKIMLEMPKLYDCTPIHLPVEVIHGKKPGPSLCVTAAVHGDELNGVEIIRRLRKKRFLKGICGTLIMVPILNVYGFLYQDRYLLDRRDLNRSFPGSETGSLAARLAHLILNQIAIKATHFIDLHTGSNHRSNLPQVRANLDKAEVKKLAICFGAQVILHSKELEGSLRKEAASRGVNFLVYEAGEAFRFDEIAIRIGLKGVLNILHALKMIDRINKKMGHAKPSITQSSYWVRATHSGIILPLKSLGKKVSTGEPLAVISNPTGREEYKVLAQEPGIIIGKSNLPLVHEGAALFHIGCFNQPKQVESDIQEHQTAHEDDALDDSTELIGA